MVNTCNEWKEFASFRLVGVYNDLTKLQAELWERFLVDEICFQGRSWPDIQEAIHEEWASRWEDEDVEEDGGDLEEGIFQAIQDNEALQRLCLFLGLEWTEWFPLMDLY